MNNHELLNMIGEVNEDYVLAAGGDVVRPRFRWRTIAACAACAVLALGVYPAYQAVHPHLHDYVVMEGGGILDTQEEEKVPQGAAIDVPGQGGEKGGEDIDGTHLGEGDIPVDAEAAGQYDRLLRGMGIHVEGTDAYPDWFAGAWIDHGGAPGAPAWLTVAIVEGFRTSELETEILGWTQNSVVFRDAKYSKNFLDGLMDSVVAGIDGTGLSCGIGVDVVENCVGVDLYSNGAVIPDSVLAELARLDPDGDAIRVRLFTGKLDTLTDELQKGPEPVEPEARSVPAVTEDDESAATPVDGSGPVYHGEDVPADVVPGGACADDLPQAKEEDRLARYDLLPLDE